ncbi:MAG: pyridoxine 5'-phosphate synthase [Deltaproteobacteria bacterium GWC2_42_11]|nr:MAG: pyridoxine 5'-phosphate synthase [Deltaproteobacteria bacterium GWC2_42_11]HBO83673.1 pyridoxine 5'-phosphate synthase [Deltaproteobacteria bacterium]
MARLSVNIDHIATVRQARRGIEPDPVTGAMIAEISGADGITVHLREDRRHIQDRDMFLLKKMVKTKLNLEMAATQEMLKIALEVKPYMVTIVPEKREELTTEGGLDVRTHRDYLKKYTEAIRDSGINVNLFINPEPEQVKAAHMVNASGIEIHTGRYAELTNEKDIEAELIRINNAVLLASKLKLSVHAGHGLDYSNIKRLTEVNGIEEFAIGFSIIARSIFVGIERSVKEMKELIA